jgi:hypothetical protein
MKTPILVLLASVLAVHAQTVSDLTTTNGTLQATNLRINTATNFNFGGVGGVIEVEANDNHAFAGRASDITDGVVFYGWSESGAPVAKFAQTNNFNSPALTIWRTPNGDDTLSPAMLIAGSPASATNKALSIRNGSSEVFWIKYDGTYPPGGYSSTGIDASVIDWRAAETFYKTLTGNSSFTFSNTRDGQVIVVVISNPSTFTVNWPSSGDSDVRWSGGIAPAQTPGGTDLYTFSKIGGVIYGAVNTNMQ